MTKLSVNINKIATLRNARGGTIPNVLKVAADLQRFGAQGITVHPRPDERHIRYNDVLELKQVITTEYNIEGYPSKEWMDLVLKVKPHQATLVPDAPTALTSNAGWDIVKNQSFLSEIVSELNANNIRSSIFVDPIKQQVEKAAELGAKRIELYTEPFASGFSTQKENAVKPYRHAAEIAKQAGLDVNAGHDLNLQNLNYFFKQVQPLSEVSIGHALIADALYYGLENTVQLYLRQLS